MPVVRASVGLQFDRYSKSRDTRNLSAGIQRKNRPLLLGRDAGIFNEPWVRITTAEVPVHCHHARNSDKIANLGGLFARHDQVVEIQRRTNRIF